MQVGNPEIRTRNDEFGRIISAEIQTRIETKQGIVQGFFNLPVSDLIKVQQGILNLEDVTAKAMAVVLGLQPSDDENIEKAQLKEAVLTADLRAKAAQQAAQTAMDIAVMSI